MGGRKRGEQMSLTDGPNIPSGYRQGFITATTVLLTASLLYFRYAALEPGSGDWTPWGVVSVVILSMSICIQLYTLWRALQPDDEKILVYKITLRWFAAAVFLLVVSFVTNVVASLAYGGSDESSPGGAANLTIPKPAADSGSAAGSGLETARMGQIPHRRSSQCPQAL
jgi:hypothetical protein